MTRTVADEVRFWRHGGTGVELLKARFGGHAYDRHAHDSYAIGVTLQGRQGFHHRGRRSPPCYARPNDVTNPQLTNHRNECYCQ